MNLKNHRAKYWVILTAVLLMVGVGVFCLLRLPDGPMITRGVDQEELPKIRAAVGHHRMHKFMEAFRTLKWKELPGLAADYVGCPVVGGMSVKGNLVLVLIHSKKSGTEGGYVVERSGRGWKVVANMSPGGISFPITQPF